MKKTFFIGLFMVCIAQCLYAQGVDTHKSKFKQLEELLPTPTTYRTGSGAPGHQYWQQQADYDIAVELDDEKQSISGFETITYTNNSPDKLSYLWLQLDQNLYEKNSLTKLTSTGKIEDKMSFKEIQNLMDTTFDGGYKIAEVKDKTGKNLSYTINYTMMRVDLPKVLKTGESFSFTIKWKYNINNQPQIGGRSGYEYFPNDKNYLYEIAQFHPRMAVYDDVNGWQHKQFIGRAEFALPFGNYKVSITVPSDHVVAASGELQNMSQVLTPTQLERWEKAKKSTTPVLIISEDEAIKAEETRAKTKKTWIFKADNVRDFAFASSRKFIWDAMQVNVEGKNVMAMSFYPKEGNPLWGQYSTQVVAHALRVYSKHTIAYPYPVAISVHGSIWGMEYPMICFNGGRPDTDGTYSAAMKYAMISVIIHEVGHNFFPMIINSDERQWAWMDEGLNSFVQFLTEQEWEYNYPSRRGFPEKLIDYMVGDKENQIPIMSNAESIFDLGNNSYGKPAVALNILRETVMGRELFDFAFKEYSKRWAFKHPQPADFFRTMEDASGTDLDWFWRGWFYTNDHVDIGISDVKLYEINTKNPDTEKPILAETAHKKAQNITNIRNASDNEKTLVEKNENLKDFYNSFNPYEVTTKDKERFDEYLLSLSEEEQKVHKDAKYFYELSFENIGGLVMPILLKIEYEDNSIREYRIPAEIWRYNNKMVSKLLPSQKLIKQITLDPYLETADGDKNNNFYPTQKQPSRFELFKERTGNSVNPMREAQLMKGKN